MGFASHAARRAFFAKLAAGELGPNPYSKRGGRVKKGPKRIRKPSPYNQGRPDVPHGLPTGKRYAALKNPNKKEWNYLKMVQAREEGSFVKKTKGTRKKISSRYAANAKKKAAKIKSMTPRQRLARKNQNIKVHGYDFEYINVKTGSSAHETDQKKLTIGKGD